LELKNKLKKQILITVSYIAEIDENLLTGKEEAKRREIFDNPLDNQFPPTMKISDDICAEWENTSIMNLDPKSFNCTKCNACGSWITDKSKPDYIAGLGIGEYVEDKIYCPECALFARDKQSGVNPLSKIHSGRGPWIKVR